ncbi:MAG: hypothetical protein WC608_04100 [Parcubacteria group bacterium]
MKKVIIIIIAILIALFLFNVILGVIRGITKADDYYGEKMFFYKRDRICYECIEGVRKGFCPAILSNEEKFQYPNATEYSGRRDLKVDVTDYSDENIIKNNVCESWHHDLISKKDFDYTRIAMPEKSYSYSIQKEIYRGFEGVGVLLCGIIPGCSF